jgi:hypothetical protein
MFYDAYLIGPSGIRGLYFEEVLSELQRVGLDIEKALEWFAMMEQKSPTSHGDNLPHYYINIQGKRLVPFSIVESVVFGSFIDQPLE